MKNSFFLLALLCASSLFGWQSFEVLGNPQNIEITKKVQFLKDDKNLTAFDAYKIFINGNFQNFSDEARSFGLTNSVYWVALEVKNQSEEKLFLELRNPTITSINYFVYQKGILIHSAHSGSMISLYDRPVKSSYLRYSLLRTDTPTIYLLKIQSQRSLAIPLQIGSRAELDYYKIPGNIIFATFGGCLFGLFLYNLILYISTKEKAYLLYSIYLLFFFVCMMSINDYLSFLLYEYPVVWEHIRPFSIQGFHITLALFTLYALDIKRLSPKVFKATLSICVATFVLFLLFYIFAIWRLIGYATILFLFALCIYLAIFEWQKGSKIAKIYLLALGGYFVGLCALLASLSGLLPYCELIFNGVYIGAMWEIVLLSFMLAYMVKLLQNERDLAIAKNETDSKIIFLQSRYASMGETVGNIAHQWKQPLNAIGAIQTGIKAALIYKGEIAKDKLLESVDTSFEILRHLSETIDTFYGFLTQRDCRDGIFVVSKELDSIKKITEYSFDNRNIKLIFEIHVNPEIQGSANEFTHALLNIILNAKDAFDNEKIDSPKIHIYVTDEDDKCVITIADNAGGIRIEPLETIFDMNVSSKENSGGLGLFMAKNIIEKRFGGSIKVENKDGGAFFTIELPYKRVCKLLLRHNHFRRKKKPRTNQAADKQNNGIRRGEKYAEQMGRYIQACQMGHSNTYVQQ